VFELPGVGRVEPLTVFPTPLIHCQIMSWGSAIYYIHTTYITVLFGAPTVEKFNPPPPANFSQFKHWSRLVRSKQEMSKWSLK